MYFMNAPFYTFILVGLYTIWSARAEQLDKLGVKEQRGGWLDRFVSSYKDKSLNAKENTTKLGTVVPKPQGYEDSKKRILKPVLRLSTLVSESKMATPVREVLRHIPKFIKKPTDGWLDKLAVAGVAKKQQIGWLDRFVSSYNAKRLNSTGNAIEHYQNQMKNTVKFKATIVHQPSLQGYADSKKWTFESVSRLSTLLSENKTATTVPQVLRLFRKMIKKPTRRLNNQMTETFEAGSQSKLKAASVHKQRGGWLDRFVSCLRAKGANATGNATKDCQDQMKNAVEFKATIVPKPQGYEDSKNWTFESVSRLLTLISESKTATPVRRALRRILQFTNMRRFNMNVPMKESFKRFPSLIPLQPNEFYYDATASDYSEELMGPEDDSIITIVNPVESQLPSRKLSINLLRDIMVQRVIQARKLPPAKTLVPWDSDQSCQSSDEHCHQNGNYHRWKPHHNRKPHEKGYLYNRATGSYYKLHDNKATWFVANGTCVREGAHLLVLNDAKEAQTIESIYRNATGSRAPRNGVWLGLRNQRVRGVIVWRTVRGEPISKVFHKWYQGRPYNDERHTCAVFNADDKQLHDWSCNTHWRFICEISQ